MTSWSGSALLSFRKSLTCSRASISFRMRVSWLAGTPFRSLPRCAAIALSAASRDMMRHLPQTSNALESESSSSRSLSSTAFLARRRNSREDASGRCSALAPRSRLSSAALPKDAPRRSPDTRRAGASASEKIQSCLRARGELSSIPTPIITRMLRNSCSFLARPFATLTLFLMSATHE